MADEFTLHDLRRILRAAAGEPEGDLDLEGDIGDLSFDELGYDSVSLLEAAGLITREYGIDLADDALFDAPTPNALLAVVNTEQATHASGR